MEKSIDVIKVITHADGGEEYTKNATKYPSNEYCVGLKGYGVDAYNPETAKMQFETVAKYYNNDGKNQFIQYMISFLKETAPDAETAMTITGQAMDTLKENHQMLIGVHEKHREKSDFHTHSFVGTTNLETGKMIHSTNKLNYTMAQNLADIIQKPVELVIEKKSKEPKQNTSKDGEKKKNDDFTRIFYPHKKYDD